MKPTFAPPFSPRRRNLLQAAVLSALPAVTLAGPHSAPASAAAERVTPGAKRRHVVSNVTGLYSVEVARVAQPRSTAEVAAAVRAWPGEVAVGGGRYSMGGQVAIRGGLHVDMRSMREVVWLQPEARIVRVQAGLCWRDLQDVLDPLGLAVKTMQSYANFTVGGSVSVNVHGRYLGHGPIAHSVRALQLVLADGSVVEASRSQQPELFAAAIGGYGAVGVITEVELELAENVRIARRVQEVPLSDYVRFFEQEVRSDPGAVLHNADLVPPAFDRPVAVTWMKVGDDVPLSVEARLVVRGGHYRTEQAAIFALTELPGAAVLRQRVIAPSQRKPEVKWLNHEASKDVGELEPTTRAVSTYVLQEFFIPAQQLVPFARAMAGVLKRNRVEALNISIRHAPADRDTLLKWAVTDVFSLVLYFKQRTSVEAQQWVARWTRELIEIALAHDGRYYLPYQLHATRPQFERAYPEVEQLRKLKARIDPSGKLSNELWRAYL